MTVKKDTSQTKTAGLKRKKQKKILESKNPILNSEEKRRLILAHLAKREIKTRDPLQAASLYAGVAVTTLIVIFGWFYAFSPNILQAVKNPFGEMNDLTAQFDDLKNMADEAEIKSEESDLSKMLKQATEDLNLLSKQTENERFVLERLVASVSSTAQEENRVGFNNPVRVTSSTSAVKKITATTTLE